MYESDSPLSDDRRHPQAGTLEAAIAYLRGGLRPDGSYEGVSEWETTEYQWRSLADWCHGRGLIVEQGPERPGGSEHDVRFENATRRWVKYTKPNRAGYVVEVLENDVLMLPAQPLQYLERWKVSNALFGDDVEFLGIWTSGKNRSLVISQSDLVGEAPTWEELTTWFENTFSVQQIHPPKSLGGYLSRCFLGGRLAVFDVRPLNCVRTLNGKVVPFDVIPQYFTHSQASTLGRLCRRLDLPK